MLEVLLLRDPFRVSFGLLNKVSIKGDWNCLMTYLSCLRFGWLKSNRIIKSAWRGIFLGERVVEFFW